jgi:hypothetical protein
MPGPEPAAAGLVVLGRMSHGGAQSTTHPPASQPHSPRPPQGPHNTAPPAPSGSFAPNHNEEHSQADSTHSFCNHLTYIFVVLLNLTLIRTTNNRRMRRANTQIAGTRGLGRRPELAGVGRHDECDRDQWRRRGLGVCGDDAGVTCSHGASGMSRSHARPAFMADRDLENVRPSRGLADQLASRLRS